MRFLTCIDIHTINLEKKLPFVRYFPLKKNGYTVEFGHLPNIESDCTINQISVFSLAVGHKVQRFDGYYNNLAYPTWGSAGMSRTFLL